MAILCLARPKYDGNAQFTQKIRPCLMAILSLATPRYDGNAQFTQKIRLCLMAIIYRKRLLMAMLSFDKIETNDGNVQSDGNDQFRQKETSDGNA